MRKIGILLASVLFLAALAPLVLAQGTPVSPREHGPRIALGLLPERVVGDVKVWASGNWSGYAVIGNSFTQARGSWRVPAVDCTETPYSSASFWVGMDGWNDSTVEQTGTESDCDDETPKYYAWYEFAPKGGVTIGTVPVSPGDRISAEVNYDGAEFTVTITNEETGDSFNTSAVVPGAQRSSAEWIAEENSPELADFGTAPFGRDFTDVIDSNAATDAGASGPIGAFRNRVQASIIIARGRTQAVPSGLSEDGSSFAVTWKSQ
jgi:hypothetical protein